MDMKAGDVVLITDDLSMWRYEDKARVVGESSTRAITQSWEGQPYPLPDSVIVTFLEGPYTQRQKEIAGNLCRKLPGPESRNITIDPHPAV